MTREEYAEFLYPADPDVVETPEQPARQNNNGYCRKCYRDGVKHRTAIMCPECNDCLGGF